MMIFNFSFNTETFKQVASLVAGVELTDHIIDIVFAIFDENRKFFLRTEHEHTPSQLWEWVLHGRALSTVIQESLRI